MKHQSIRARLSKLATGLMVGAVTLTPWPRGQDDGPHIDSQRANLAALKLEYLKHQLMK